MSRIISDEQAQRLGSNVRVVTSGEVSPAEREAAEVIFSRMLQAYDDSSELTMDPLNPYQRISVTVSSLASLIRIILELLPVQVRGAAADVLIAVCETTKERLKP